ncbi:hypothetical protein [Brevundimonas nasdae]|uniref:hypothetical protein n=1 Tax=Brevundimonas nasdae TaxID=172043 RepID=UPI003F68E43F
MNRPVSTSSTVMAGCFTCRGSVAIWTGKNAIAVAARHHDATGHQTWADQNLSIRYGLETTSHPDLFPEAVQCA